MGKSLPVRNRFFGLLLVLLSLPLLARPREDLRALELRIIELVNLRRVRAHSPEVKEDRALSGVARGHSQDMVRLHFFAHESPLPGKRLAADRVRAAAVPILSVGENLVKVPYGRKDPAEEAVRGWLSSSGHAANLLQETHRVTGIGVVRGPDGYFICQLFGREATAPKAPAHIGMVFHTKEKAPLPEAIVNTNPPYTQDDRALAGRLLKTRPLGDFALDDRHDYRNLRAFLYLAETHQDPIVVSMALACLSNLYSWNPSAYATYTKPLVGTVPYRRVRCDNNALRVLKRCLASSDPSLRASATLHVDSLVDINNGDAEVQRLVAQSALDPADPGRQMNAIYVLNRFRGKSSVRDDADWTLLGDPKVVIVYTVLAAQSKYAEFTRQEMRDQMLARMFELCHHADPGVRAAALEAVLNRAGQEGVVPVRRALHLALSDKHPGVRAEAALLLRVCDGVGSLQQLAELGSDLSSIRQFTWPDGHWTTLEGLESVGDVALRTLDRLSSQVEGLPNFAYALRNTPSGKPTAVELQILKSEGIRARQWAKENQARLPRLD